VLRRSRSLLTARCGVHVARVSAICGSKTLLWSNVAADAIIAGTYGVIAFRLAAFVSRNRADIPAHWMFLAFGTFILAFGGNT